MTAVIPENFDSEPERRYNECGIEKKTRALFRCPIWSCRGLSPDDGLSWRDRLVLYC